MLGSLNSNLLNSNFVWSRNRKEKRNRKENPKPSQPQPSTPRPNSPHRPSLSTSLLSPAPTKPAQAASSPFPTRTGRSTHASTRPSNASPRSACSPRAPPLDFEPSPARRARLHSLTTLAHRQPHLPPPTAFPSHASAPPSRARSPRLCPWTDPDPVTHWPAAPSAPSLFSKLRPCPDHADDVARDPFCPRALVNPGNFARPSNRSTLAQDRRLAFNWPPTDPRSPSYPPAPPLALAHHHHPAPPR